LQKVQFDDDEDTWDLDQDGNYLAPGMVTSKEQAERWQDLGYDMAAGVRREADFLDAYDLVLDDPEKDHKQRRRMMIAYMDAETRIALESGVPESDPDFWRIACAYKYLDRGSGFTLVSGGITATVPMPPETDGADLFAPR